MRIGIDENKRVWMNLLGVAYTPDKYYSKNALDDWTFDTYGNVTYSIDANDYLTLSSNVDVSGETHYVEATLNKRIYQKNFTFSIYFSGETYADQEKVKYSITPAIDSYTFDSGSSTYSSTNKIVASYLCIWNGTNLTVYRTKLLYRYCNGEYTEADTTKTTVSTTDKLKIKLETYASNTGTSQPDATIKITPVRYI